jgi:hypothetical protein
MLSVKPVEAIWVPNPVPPPNANGVRTRGSSAKSGTAPTTARRQASAR